jgi:hypothetical protein
MSAPRMGRSSTISITAPSNRPPRTATTRETKKFISSGIVKAKTA